MTLDKSSISILVGASETLAATVSPKDAANKKVSWKSDKPEIATVDASGKITGVKEGEATITVTTEDGGKTATLYALPTQSIVTEDGITLTVKYDGKFYTKTFAGKEFKENSNITLAAPSLEGGWAEAVTEYAAADLKMGDYLYSDGTTSDGGLRKLYPDGEYEAETIAPLTGTDKRIIGIVIYAGRHATDNSDYTKALTEGGPAISGNVNGYAMAITNATGTRTSMTADRPAWLIGPGGGDYIYDLENSYIWLRHIYCSRLGITNKFVLLSASEYICGLDLKQSKLL